MVSGVPRVGQTVQASAADGSAPLIGTVIADITERTLVLESPSGRCFLVRVKDSRFEVHGQDDIPLPPEPDEG